MKLFVYLLVIFFSVKAKDIWIPYVSIETIRSLPKKTPDEGIGMLKYVIKLLYEYDKESRNYPVLMDIGANIGKITKEMADIYFSGKIYAFEPFKLSLDALKLKTSNNPNVEAVVEAVSNVTTINQPFYSAPAWSAPMNTMSSLSNYLDGYSIVEYSNTTTLSNFMERKSIFIDAEGYDGIIIKDSLKLFYQHRIKYLYFEYISIWKAVDPNLKIEYLVNELDMAGYNLYVDYYGNFLPLNQGQINRFKNLEKMANILAILKGEGFERKLLRRLCPFCGY